MYARAELGYPLCPLLEPVLSIQISTVSSGITFEDGAVQQSNYYDYDVVRSDNYPTVVTHIVPHPFSVHATGVGEPGVPPVSPAIANGLFAATGERRRHLPMGVDA